MPANLPVAFAAVLAGGLLTQKGAKALQGTFGGGADHTAAAAVSPATGHVVSGSQKQQVKQVAARYGLSPQTLWGVYGTESSFGTDPSTSSAGAQGPFQFLLSTWREWGHGSINSFSDSLDAAARYLKSLGADSNPTSDRTLAALNAYNGNGGGPHPTGYTSSVEHLGGEL